MKQLIGLALAAAVGFAASVVYVERVVVVRIEQSSSEAWFPRAYGIHAPFLGQELATASGGRPFASEEACQKWAASVVDFSF
jgi:hypothetical protein